MKNVFLKKDFVIKLVLLSLVFLLILPVLYFLLWIILVSVFIFLFRKNKVDYKNSLSNSVDIILSPVSGKVTEIFTDQEGQQFIKIVAPMWGPFGLYLPYSSEVVGSQKVTGKKLWRGSKLSKLRNNAERFMIEFQNKLGHKTVIETYACIAGGSPDVWMRAGDKGRSSACFGFVPFGGSIIIKLPKQSDLQVKENEKIKAGFTILAGIKG